MADANDNGHIHDHESSKQSLLSSIKAKEDALNEQHRSLYEKLFQARIEKQALLKTQQSIDKRLQKLQQQIVKEARKNDVNMDETN